MNINGIPQNLSLQTLALNNTLSFPVTPNGLGRITGSPGGALVIPEIPSGAADSRNLILRVSGVGTAAGNGGLQLIESATGSIMNLQFASRGGTAENISPRIVSQQVSTGITTRFDWGFHPTTANGYWGLSTINPTWQALTFVPFGFNRVLIGTTGDSANGQVQMLTTKPSDGLAFGTGTNESIYRPVTDSLQTNALWTVQRTVFDSNWPVVIGHDNSIINTGNNNFLLVGIANSGLFSGVGNSVVGYGNTFNADGATMPTGFTIVGYQNVVSVTGGAGANINNAIFGTANGIFISTGTINNNSMIVGRACSLTINSGNAISCLNYGSSNTVIVNSGSSIGARQFGRTNTINLTSGFSCDPISQFGFSNNLILNSGVNISNISMFGDTNVFLANSTSNATASTMIGYNNNLGMTGVVNVTLNFVNGTQNSLYFISGNSNNSNSVVGALNYLNITGDTNAANAGSNSNNSIVGNSNTYNVFGSSNQNNSIFGRVNTVVINSGTTNQDAVVFGRSNVWTVNTGFSNGPIIFGNGNQQVTNSGNTNSSNSIIGRLNSVFQVATANMSSNNVFGISNILSGINTNQAQNNSLFGSTNKLVIEASGNGINNNSLIGFTNTLNVSSGAFQLANNSVIGANNTLQLKTLPGGANIPASFALFNNLVGSNNQASGIGYTTLIGQGLNVTGSTGLWIGMGNAYLNINSGAGTLTYNGVNPTYPVFNRTGNFTLTSSQFRYVWTGSATWTGILPSPSLYSGMDFLIKNISTTSSLALSGNIDYGVNSTLSSLQAVRLWSDNNSWLLI